MLDVSTCLPEIETLNLLLRSLYGPTSSSVTTQNSIGGDPTVCADIGSLLVNYEAVHPTTKLVIAAIIQQDTHFSDGRCFMGLILTDVVRRCWLSGFHPRMCCDVLSWCQNLISTHLPLMVEKTFAIRTEDIIEHLYAVIGCKVRWYLSRQETERLVHTLTEVFIRSGGDINSQAGISFCHSNCMRFSCQLHEGILLDGHHSPVALPSGHYRAVLIQASLCGDTDELADITYSSSNQSRVSEAVVSLLEKLVDRLVSLKVDLILCQKVIHPSIKNKLRSYSILYQERLGGSTMSKLQRYTGTTALTSLTESTPHLEPVDLSCCHVTIQRETWTLLTTCHPGYGGADRYACCVVLSHWSRQVANVIEKSCIQSLNALSRLLQDNRLLCGGGKWQRDLADVLDNRCEQVSSEEARKSGATRAVFRQVVRYLTTHLRSLVKEEDNSKSVYDGYITQSSALTSALTVAKAVILIGNTMDAG